MKVIQFIDRQIHPDLMKDELLHTRARIITAFIVFSVAFYLIANAAVLVGRSIPQGYLSRSHIFLGVPIIFYALIMLLLRGSGRLKLSGHLILMMQFCMVIGGIILSGGGSSIVLFFLGVMIILAFLFVGPVHGAIWALILAATHIAFISVSALEFEPQMNLRPDQREVFELLTVISLYMLTFVAAVSYDYTTTYLIRKIRMERREYKEGAHLDELTALGNRRQFDLSLSAMIDHARSTHGSFALAFLDLDKFKPINDQLGHDAGDRVLQICAERISTSIRAGDIACRFGGDEFAVLFQHVSREEHAATAVTHVLKAIERPIELDARTVTLSASAGVALFPAHAAETQSLLDLADTRMYKAKRGDEGFCVSDG
jgi:diguanylate cyclase (GGDEF)-like protein